MRIMKIQQNGLNIIPASEKKLKRYCKQVKALLPLYRKQEKLFMENFSASVKEFAEVNLGCSIEDVIENFGVPGEIVSDYLSELDIEDLCRQISIRRRMKQVISAILILCVIASGLNAWWAYETYLEAKDQIITEEVIVIE
ncbi:hypothetical protein D3Z38_11820 [Clostridiales bacterium]|nr:hypothetical protein [Clostridiales bacterium]